MQKTPEEELLLEEAPEEELEEELLEEEEELLEEEELEEAGGEMQVGILQLEVVKSLQQGSSLAKQRNCSLVVQSGTRPEVQ